jgi:hypothetical protein
MLDPGMTVMMLYKMAKQETRGFTSHKEGKHGPNQSQIKGSVPQTSS